MSGARPAHAGASDGSLVPAILAVAVDELHRLATGFETRASYLATLDGTAEERDAGWKELMDLRAAAYRLRSTAQRMVGDCRRVIGSEG